MYCSGGTKTSTLTITNDEQRQQHISKLNIKLTDGGSSYSTDKRKFLTLEIFKDSSTFTQTVSDGETITMEIQVRQQVVITQTGPITASGGTVDCTVSCNSLTNAW